MRRSILVGVSLILMCAAISPDARAGNHNPSDYPLRVQVLMFRGQSHFFAGSAMAWDEGEGRGNLYENGEPGAMDFKVKCQDRMRVSNGFGTFMARWKKLKENLEILIPDREKPQSTWTCELKVEMKAGIVYVAEPKGLATVSSAAYKQWMQRAQFDPEHGKNVPVGVATSDRKTAPQ
jgi:hypothetical protein